MLECRRSPRMCATLRGFRAYECVVSDSRRLLRTGLTEVVTRACCGEPGYGGSDALLCQNTTVRPSLRRSSEPVDDQILKGEGCALHHAWFHEFSPSHLLAILATRPGHRNERAVLVMRYLRAVSGPVPPHRPNAAVGQQFRDHSRVSGPKGAGRRHYKGPISTPRYP
ncbi:hypothetical protein MPH_10858 [Macrophomina phaseolina MS6]|uniref:Uncharacterized protein n=1 Tax=Macrophomina phaseolina (strain MS6) TaxID=1126212 RepID=K2RBN3_MACPH|nr:hypothetical protein MPH_10858 [Macrophomina phaseolina MS6]